mgnify:CR=1 FL=1
MNKTAVIFTFIAILTFGSFEINAQDEGKEGIVDLYAGVGLMNRFIWRGMNLGGNSPSIQPYVGMMIKNFEIGVWGAYSVGGEFTNQEFDLYAAYYLFDGALSISVIDYYSASDIFDYNYFDYNNETTGHFYEAALKFNGTENIPFSFSANMIFYGADVPRIVDDPSSDDFNLQDGIQYSNYFELGYTKDVNQLSLNAFLGFTLSNPKKADPETGYAGEFGFYGNGPGVIHTGITVSRDIPITEKFSLPLTSSVITNPQSEKVFFLVGFSF